MTGNQSWATPEQDQCSYHWAEESTLIQLSMVDYENPSWVRGWNRKIHPKDHHLASRGLQSDDKRWSRGTDFFLSHPDLTWLMDSFSCSQLKYRISYWKKHEKRLPENPEFAEMRHGDVTDRLAAEVWLFVFIFPAGRYRYVRSKSHVGKNNGNPDLVCKNIIYKLCQFYYRYLTFCLLVFKSLLTSVDC